MFFLYPECNVYVSTWQSRTKLNIYNQNDALMFKIVKNHSFLTRINSFYRFRTVIVLVCKR